MKRVTRVAPAVLVAFALLGSSATAFAMESFQGLTPHTVLSLNALQKVFAQDEVKEGTHYTEGEGSLIYEVYQDGKLVFEIYPRQYQDLIHSVWIHHPGYRSPQVRQIGDLFSQLETGGVKIECIPGMEANQVP